MRKNKQILSAITAAFILCFAVNAFGQSKRNSPFDRTIFSSSGDAETIQSPAAAGKRFDYTGDGKADLITFRRSTGNWWVYDIANEQKFQITFWGAPGDIPTLGNYDGDAKADLAIVRPDSSDNRYQIWIRESSTQTARPVEKFGTTDRNDFPVLYHDYDGDGKTDLVIARYGTTPFSKIEWWIKQSSDGAVKVFRFGNNFDVGGPVDVALSGDVDGDGRSDLIVWRYRTGDWFVKRASDGAEFYYTTFGLSDDFTALGDYDGDGKTDIAVYRDSNRTFYVLRSSDQNYQIVQMDNVDSGATRSAAADYDGDGKTDFAVFHESTGDWYIKMSGSNYNQIKKNWGIAEDILPAQGLSIQLLQ